MRGVKIAFFGTFIVLICVWLMTGNIWPEPFGYFPFRSYAMQLTGILAFGVMSCDMVLATRPSWLEKPLNGMDKAYRLHKWFGISALVLGIVHWLLGKGTKWAVDWGWLIKPARRGAKAKLEASIGLEQWMRSMRHTAETIGEWAFYAAVVLIIIALVSRIPYHWFTKVHKLFAFIYLALVFHSVILVKYGYWTQPFGWVVAIIAVAGTISAFIVLFDRIGCRRRVLGEICALHHEELQHLLMVDCRVSSSWAGHKPGQFAYVVFDSKERAHPYTIASAWDNSKKCLRFIIKGLGDHTSLMPKKLKIGDRVAIEGPYGCFTFEDNKPVQIWIGAGIGVTPFLARLDYLKNNPEKDKAIVFFHTVADCPEDTERKLQEKAKAVNIKLHFMLDTRDGYLTGQKLRELVPDWRQASVWFCGPVGFAKGLENDLVANGLERKAFHRELFQMR